MVGRSLFRRILLGALVLRAFFAFSLSYIHPDEHLQGPQVIAHGLFGYAAQWPWEFRTENPIRSFVPLWLFYGIPMSLFPESVRPEFTLYAIRALMAFVTWVLGDMAIDRLSNHKGAPLTALLFSATSYVTWTYQSHTLSNSFETVLVLWFLVILHEFEHTRRDPIDKHMDCFLLGIIFVVGVFNRPTFVAWVLVPGVQLLKFGQQHPWSFTTFVLSVALSASCCVYLDTLAYGSDHWVITPLNNLRYNSDPANLALHGTHPWYLHLVSSIPQLLGPGILFLRPQWTLQTQSIVGAVALLSLVPHQEPRFLMPIVPLLCTHMQYRDFPVKWHRPLIALWLVFNLSFGLLMGVLHQGGILAADIWLGQNAVASPIVWWKTYNPPLWLMGLQQNEVKFADSNDGLSAMKQVLKSQSNYTRVVDLMGSSADDVEAVLAKAPRPLYFVAPLASKHEQFTQDKKPIWVKRAHLSLDIIDVGDWRTLQPGLGIWLL